MVYAIQDRLLRDRVTIRGFLPNAYSTRDRRSDRPLAGCYGRSGRGRRLDSPHHADPDPSEPRRTRHRLILRTGTGRAFPGAPHGLPAGASDTHRLAKKIAQRDHESDGVSQLLLGAAAQQLTNAGVRAWQPGSEFSRGHTPNPGR